jgi:threonine dehydratase
MGTPNGSGFPYWSMPMYELTFDDISEARERIHGRVRPVVLTRLDPALLDSRPTMEPAQAWLALEHLQYTGSFKARGAQNFLLAHHRAGHIPAAGVAIASGGNAGVAFAWAAAALKVTATVFVPISTPPAKVAALRRLGALLRLAGDCYDDAAEACARFVRDSGALAGHAHDDPLIAAGAGTVLEEITAQIPDLDTVVVAVGGGGLLAGVATAARHRGVRVVAVEPEGAPTLHAALKADRPVPVAIDTIAADALGVRRLPPSALNAAKKTSVISVTVPDREIIQARRELWRTHRIAVEHGTATVLAALTAAASGADYRPSPGERVALVLCGANTDPADLTRENPL